MKHVLPVIAISLILLGCDKQAQQERLEEKQDETYHFLLGEIALDRDDTSAAMEHYNQLSDASADPIIAARATSIALENEDYIQAAKSAKIWADSMPEDLQTQAITASIFLKNNDIKGATPFLSRLINTDDEETFQQLLMIKSTLEDEAHAQSFVDLMQTYGENNKDYRVLFMGALTAHETGKNQRAKIISDQIVKLNPDWVRGNILNIQLTYEAGNIDAALKSIDKLIAKNPQDNLFRYLKAKMLLAKGDTAGGIKMLETLKTDPEYRDEALIEIARFSLQNQDFQTGEVILKEYLKNNPDDDESRYFLGFSQQQLGKFDDALNNYRAIKKGYYYVNSNIQIALIYSANQYTDEALKTLEGLSLVAPEDRSRIDLVRTQILLDANRIEDAYSELNKILSKDSTDTELKYIRGLLAMELGHVDQAEGDFKAIIAVQPQHLDALNDLSNILLSKQQYDEAKVYIDKALVVAPNDPQALDNMGWVLHLTGQQAAAIPYLKKAHSMNQDDVIAAHLGQVLWATGDEQGAIQVWNAAADTLPNHPYLIQIMREHLVQPANAR